MHYCNFQEIFNAKIVDNSCGYPVMTRHSYITS